MTTTYDHWVADSVSARLILRHILGRYCGLSIRENDEPLELYPATYREAFGRRLRGVRLAMATAVRCAIGERTAPPGRWPIRRARKWPWAISCIRCRRTGWSNCDISPALRERRSTNVLLAALARTMGEFLPRRWSRGKSREMALGSIVDTRPIARGDLSHTVGMFLAYYLVRRGHDRKASLAETTREVAEMTRPIKERQRYLDSMVNMKFINMIWPYLRESWKPHFMRKALPMTAGVTNIVLRERWLEENRGRILGYSRGSPIPPNVPLALAPTTLGDEMTIGITYRATGFGQEKIDGVVEMLLDQLEHPARGSQFAADAHRRSARRNAAAA